MNSIDISFLSLLAGISIFVFGLCDAFVNLGTRVSIFEWMGFAIVVISGAALLIFCLTQNEPEPEKKFCPYCGKELK